MDGQRPHMVIGVDLGMTCTGVAYSNLSIGSSTVRWVQKWPGRMQANENKVPTVVVYPFDDPTPSSWGFASETTIETTATDKEYKEWFKTCLDPVRLAKRQEEDPEEAPKNIQEVEKWYEDYMRKMYEYLSFKLGGELSGTTWEEARIEFIFSVPTTWPPIPVVENFRRIATLAGFGSIKSHSVSIGLTEAEAAAVHISTEAPGIFRPNDILLVCDAGGGTTDLSVLRVTTPNGSPDSQDISLQQLDVVFGETIGSAAIDYEFEKMVSERLERANETAPLNIDYQDAAWEMMKSRDFQAVKCEYGAPDDTPLFSIAIPRLPYTYNHPDPEMRIKGGEMTFNREDLQRLFDKQIKKLIKLIDTQFLNLDNRYPGEQVRHLVLSGGLGNSAYVQQRLRTQYSASSLPNAQNVTLRISPDPQLAVCKGMVSDRVRKILTSKSVLGTRCCRSSYGTMCKIRYDKRDPEHAGKELYKDPYNGKLYLIDAIAWFVKKGEPVIVDKPIIHNFVKKVTPGDPTRAFPTSVIESPLDADKLPVQMNKDTHILCEISSDLSSTAPTRFAERNRHFWSLGKHYLRIEYQIRVLIGPADLRFELWFDGEKLSKDTSINVEWMPTPPPAPEGPRDLGPVGKIEFPVIGGPGLATASVTQVSARGMGDMEMGGLNGNGGGVGDEDGKKKKGKKYGLKMGRSGK
ncbi:hypothetical protein DM02DRAFT_619306 [Periconia macrospinosa]|uniref:Actin-like ATPase domain-containing protein n=1 Tax=Periconia macrospinosa TaxID=97972 RepID=A0A2V1D726_9PLEO|nr:hypothetical protein DM02DRAFT_619306 [Periconia macrospinosa]